jgi:hypothetical protein
MAADSLRSCPLRGLRALQNALVYQPIFLTLEGPNAPTGLLRANQRPSPRSRAAAVLAKFGGGGIE